MHEVKLHSSLIVCDTKKLGNVACRMYIALSIAPFCGIDAATTLPARRAVAVFFLNNSLVAITSIYHA